MKFIILDLDGVMITSPPWRSVPILSDGFMEFNINSVINLNKLLLVTKANIILVSNHRHNYSKKEWIEIFKLRGVNKFKLIIDNSIEVNRLKQILILTEKLKFNYIIIDDDSLLEDLPKETKRYFIRILPLIGLCEDDVNLAIKLLN